jgi:hypothetical protein
VVETSGVIAALHSNVRMENGFAALVKTEVMTKCSGRRRNIIVITRIHMLVSLA